MATMKEIQQTLQKPYDRNLFAQNVLHKIFGRNFQLFAAPLLPNTEPNKSESAVINKVLHYADIELSGNRSVMCYEVTLQPTVRIEQSKVAIQQYVRKLLFAGQAALINFISPSNNDVWRFTLVAKDSKFSEKGIEEVATNPKRYTYLVEKDRPNLTMSQRLQNLSLDKNISLESLISAFSVATMSEEFFNEYKEQYQKFVEYLTGKRMLRQSGKWIEKQTQKPSPYLATIFNGDEKQARDFVKKLMGRIIFLYFVQKKRWLGATSTAYTDGDLDFIHNLFIETGSNETFFTLGLTELFFNALNSRRENDDWTSPGGKTLKIPFLNGGLFVRDEIDEIIHRKADMLTFPPELFASPLNSENINHRGFLDFLNAYNFTVYEDSLNDQTVAVDPEMLSHIFENLLEDNKEKGAFYTPKEIVHYMCQESLTQYLHTKLEGNDNRKAIEILVKEKEIINLSENQLDNINQLLDKLKICDPAIGSGAFPMGLLQEIFTVKEAIALYLTKDWNAANVKENIIQNTIYGVDIEKGAVDIARLRFWLSLVVDEEFPKPLPNLDYKIVVGDSLVSKLGDDIIDIDWDIDTTKEGAFAQKYLEQTAQLLKEISEKQREYFNHASIKSDLSNEIRNLKIDLLISQLQLMINTKGVETEPKGKGREQAKQMERHLQTLSWQKSIAELRELKQHPDKHLHFFDWKLDFPEIMNELVSPEVGFDIVIGNPPYGAKYPEEHKKYFKENYESAKSREIEENGGKIKLKGSLDTFSLFIDKSFHVMNNNSFLSFIVPLAITSSESMSSLHNMLLKSCETIKISTYSNRPKKIFESADQRVAILGVLKNLSSTKNLLTTKVNKRYENTTILELIENLQFVNSIKYIRYGRFPKIGSKIEVDILDKIFSIKNTLKDFIETKGYPVYYRAAGGRYYNIVTNFATNSSAEKVLWVEKEYQNILAAILSSNFYYWFYHIYSDTLNMKLYELEILPMPIEKLLKSSNEIEEIYSDYLKDLYENSIIKKVNYSNISEYREYYARKSKQIIDKIDLAIQDAYGLTDDEIQFIINYDLKFRTDDEQ